MFKYRESIADSRRPCQYWNTRAWPHLYAILYILVSCVSGKIVRTDNKLPGEQKQEERSGSGDVGSKLGSACTSEPLHPRVLGLLKH